MTRSIATGLPDACLVSDPSVVLGKPDPDDPDANPTWSSEPRQLPRNIPAVEGSQANPEHAASTPRSPSLVISCCVSSAFLHGAFA